MYVLNYDYYTPVLAGFVVFVTDDVLRVYGCFVDSSNNGDYRANPARFNKRGIARLHSRSLCAYSSGESCSS